MFVLNSCGGYTFSIGENIDVSMDPTHAARVMTRLRGEALLVLEGGADIHPALYGQDIVNAGMPHVVRDAHETFLYIMARRLGIPVLGICRGHQLLAVLEGGALYQDMTRDAGIDHHSYIHPVNFVDGHELTGIQRVNSMHHQSVSVVPPSGTVVAYADDGIIEAIEYPNAMGVQWHPELMRQSQVALYVYNKSRQASAQ